MVLGGIDFIALFKNLSAAGVTTLIAGAVVEVIVERIFDKKVFRRILAYVYMRYKIYKTRFRNIELRFEFTFEPNNDITKATAQSELESALDNLERESKGRFDVGKLTEGENSDLQVNIDFLDERYRMDITLSEDTRAIRNEDLAPKEAPVNSIGFSISFDFPFQQLDNAMDDIGVLSTQLKQMITSEMSGRAMEDGKIVVTPIEDGLTLDEWIQERRFDVSLLLTSEGETTSVEFHEDEAVIRTPYLNIDSEVREYLRATLLNYYL